MNEYTCRHCGYQGPCYGTPIGDAVSAPWCKKCERNDGLIKKSEGVMFSEGTPMLELFKGMGEWATSNWYTTSGQSKRKKESP